MMINSLSLKWKSHPWWMVVFLVLVSNPALLQGQTGETIRVYKPCGLLQPTKVDCFIELEVPLYRPFGVSSQREELYLPDQSTRRAPAYVLTRQIGDWQTIVRTKPERIVIEVPVGSDSSFHIYLESNSLTNAVMPSGLKLDGAYYFGQILNANGHFRGRYRIAVSFFEDRWMGLLFQDNQTWVLSDVPAGDYRQRTGADQVMFLPLELPEYFKFACSTVEKHLGDQEVIRKGDDAEIHSTTTCKQVNILLFIDYFTRSTFNSNADAIAWITGIFNAVKYVFSNEGMNINIYDIDIIQNAATDPFDTCTTTAGALHVTGNYASNRAGNWDLVHYCTKKPLGGGIAYLDVLCSTSRYLRTGVSGSLSNTIPLLPFPTPYYSWDVNVIAHELGHNFGSPHTHSCSWLGGAIDGCWPVEGNCTQPPYPTPPFKGTIMSYCHMDWSIGIDLNLGFGPQPGNLMRNRVQQATCLSSISVTAQITSPTTSTVSICAGGQQLFTTAPCANCDYQWFRNNQPIPNANASTYVATTSGSYFVRTTNGACAAQSSTVVVNVVGSTLTATATPNSLTCPGNVQLCASGASTYRWTPGNLAGACITRNLTQTTTFTVIGTTGNCTNSATVTVTVGGPPSLTATATPSTRCGPGPVTLEASGASTFRWMPGNTMGSPITRNVNQTTTFTVTGITGNCTNTATVTVQVLPRLNISATATPSTVCPGGNVSLTASGAQSYTWMPGNLTGAAVNVSPTRTTTYTVTGIDGGCTNTAAVTVTVPTGDLAINASSTSLPCPGTVTLTAFGAQNYVWQPGSYTTATVGINLQQTTTFTVIGRQGSCSNSATITVGVGPGINVTATASPSTLCSTGCTQLSASGATTYRWMPGNLFGSPITRCISGTTTFTVIGAAGNCTNSAAVTVTVGGGPPLNPTASPSIVCPGQSVMLSASNASSYTWMPGNLAGATVTVNPTQSTTYTVVGIQGSCTSTATVRVTVQAGDLAITASSTDLPCPGPVTLTATGASSYTWLPGNFQSPTLAEHLSATKSYTVIGTQGNCTNSATVTVQVGPGFSITATATPNSLCASGRVQLSATGPATQFTWLPGNINGAQITRNVNSTTTFTVIGTAGNCSASATVTVTLGQIQPVATANPPAVCPGGATTLTASGAEAYLWQPGGVSGTTRVATPTQTTTYTLIGYAGTCSGTTTIEVQVVPMPDVIANVQQHVQCDQPGVIVAACSGSCNSALGYTFTWQPGNHGPNPSGILQVSPAQTTTYTVTMRDEATGCTRSFSDPDLTTIQVLPCNNILEIYYPFCAGDPFKDQSGNGYHATPIGPPNNINAPRGSALLFSNLPGPAISNPNPQYLVLPTLPAEFSQGLTISALIRFDDPTNGQHERIVELGNGPFADNILFANHNGNLTIHTHTPLYPSTYFWAGAPRVGEFAWYTAVVTPRSIAIYVNGQLVGSQVYSNDIYRNVTRATNFIGRSSWFIYGYDSDLRGAIDEFHLINQPLTAQEIAARFSRPGWIEAAPNPVCAGGTTTLSVIEHPRTSLLWPHNNTTQTSTAAVVYMPTVFTCERTYHSGCQDLPAQLMVDTYQIPAVINGLAGSYSSSADPVSLTGTPVGGSFSGPGIVGNTFSPSIAGIGTHQICYAGTWNGCPYRICQTVQVVPPAPCQRPSRDFYYTNITRNSYTFNWGTVTGAIGYELEVVNMSTLLPVNGSPFRVSQNSPIVSFTVGGLQSNTLYRNRLRTICTGMVYSAWTTQNFFVQTLREGQATTASTLETELLVYPNPTRGLLTVQLFESPVGSGQILIHDLTGRQVFTQPIELEGGLQSFDLNLMDISSGVYRLLIEVNGRGLEPVRLVIAQ